MTSFRYGSRYVGRNTRRTDDQERDMARNAGGEQDVRYALSDDLTER